MSAAAYARRLEEWRDSSCRANSVFNLNCSTLCGSGFQKISLGEWSGYHLIWLVPVNMITSVVGIFIAPLLVAVNLIAAVIFTVVSCFSSDRMIRAYRNHFFVAGTLEILDIPLTLFMRVFFVQCSPITISTIICIGTIAGCCRCIDLREGIFLDAGDDEGYSDDRGLLPLT